MRLALMLSAVLCLTSYSAIAQSAANTPPVSPGSSSSSSTTSGAPVQDPQAVTVLNQAVAAAGGVQAISAVLDYTAKGNITYYGSEQVQGLVTVQGLISGGNIRIDATLPTGVRSWAVHDGIVSIKSETGKVTSLIQPSNVPSSDAFPYKTPLFPTSLIFPTQPLGPLVPTQCFQSRTGG